MTKKNKQTNDTQSQQIKNEEKTLLLLTFMECLFTILSMSVTIIHYSLTYSGSQLFGCWSPLQIPLNDLFFKTSFTPLLNPSL